MRGCWKPYFREAGSELVSYSAIAQCSGRDNLYVVKSELGTTGRELLRQGSRSRQRSMPFHENPVCESWALQTHTP